MQDDKLRPFVSKEEAESIEDFFRSLDEAEKEHTDGISQMLAESKQYPIKEPLMTDPNPTPKDAFEKLAAATHRVAEAVKPLTESLAKKKPVVHHEHLTQRPFQDLDLLLAKQSSAGWNQN